MGALLCCLRGNDSEDQLQNAASQQRRGTRTAPLPEHDRVSLISDPQEQGDSWIDTRGHPPMPSSFNDPRCSQPQSRHGAVKRQEIHQFQACCHGICELTKANYNPNMQSECTVGARWSSLPNRCSSPKEEDICAICLDEYIPENPRIKLQCTHDYHLSCVYEWMERSQACPMCAKVMLFNEDIA